MSTCEPCEDRPEWRESDEWPPPERPGPSTRLTLSRDGGEKETNR